LPQDDFSRAEMSEVLAVSANTINYSSSTPIPKIYFDALTGGYILTKEVTEIPKDLFANLVSLFPFDLIFKKFNDIHRLRYDNEEPQDTEEWIAQKKKYTGHDLFSFLLPFDFTYNGGGVKIEQGVLLQGILSDKCLGQKSNSIIVYLNKNYSPRVALDFVTNYQKIMNGWLVETGFSVGLGDCIQDTDPKAFEKGIKDIISTSVIKADSRAGKEQQVMDALASAMNASSKLVQEYVNKRKNSLMDMISSGAKGKLDNLCQISAIVGRQDKDGHLITEGFDDRTLPCYRRRKTLDKLSFSGEHRSLRDIHLKAEEQGFIGSSFMTGLNPREFWFHASSGRDGVINTAIRTADVGYSTRSLSKYLEDVHINSSGMVCNQADQVISFDFGYDSSRGLDSGKCVMVDGQPQFADIRSIVEKIRANKKREEAETEYKVVIEDD
jgi:DNA-directed RNA polymerase II subunit RPB1